MKKEVAVKEVNLPSVDLSEWGTPEVLGQDIIIPKILPMQASSVAVTDGKAVMGEFRDSVTNAKLGSIVEPMDIIPFHVEKFWDILEKEGDQFAWKRSDPLNENPADKNYNDNLPWVDTIDGKEIRRVRRMNFYVMLPSGINESIPYILSFKSTSYREGRKIYSQMYLRNVKAKLPPPAYTFKLSALKQKNDKGTFIVPTVELGRASTKEEIEACLYWFKLIKKGGVKVDNSDLNDVHDVVNTAGEDTGTGAF